MCGMLGMPFTPLMCVEARRSGKLVGSEALYMGGRMSL